MITFNEYKEEELLNISVSTLAWIGDAVYSLCCREFELGKNKSKPAVLHRLATARVNAGSQSEVLERVIPILNEVELGVVRRAKNSPITTKSKHYGLAEYKRATGFEALVGYLYLLNKQERLNQILELALGEEE